MVYTRPKIASFLPKTKDRIPDANTFVKIVDSNLTATNHAPVDQSLAELLVTFYNLDYETYKKILKYCNVEYTTYKKYAEDINKIVSKSNNPFMSLLQTLDIIQSKYMAINRYVSNNIKGMLSEDELRSLKEVLTDTKKKELSSAMKSFRTRANKYSMYPDLYEFIQKIGTKEAFVKSISQEIDRRVNSRVGLSRRK